MTNHFMETYGPADLDRAIHCWLEASSKLGIKVVAPYTLTVGNESRGCLAFLPDFGGPNGMVVAALTSSTLLSDPRLHEPARKRGLFCSSVDPRGWAQYDEAVFKEALEDWGYYGPQDKCPAWFKGYKGGRSLP